MAFLPIRHYFACKTFLMQNYLNQLLRDIADVGSTFERKPEPENLEDVMEYIKEDLSRIEITGFSKTLGDYLDLEKIRFPDAEILSEAQCESLTEALQASYLNLGVGILMPPQAPPRTRYRATLKALDEHVITPSFGVYQVQTCSEPYQGYCPYGLKQCACASYWRRQLVALMFSTEEPEEWIRIGYAMIMTQAIINSKLKYLDNNPTPNTETVMNIFSKLHGAWEALNEKGCTLWYNPDEEQIPSEQGRTLLEWTGYPVSIFPEFHQLQKEEALLLSAGMLRLVGDVSILPDALKLEHEKQYNTLVRHVSCELRLGEFDAEPALLCPPEEPHIYHTLTSEEKYWIHRKKALGKFF